MAEIKPQKQGTWVQRTDKQDANLRIIIDFLSSFAGPTGWERVNAFRHDCLKPANGNLIPEAMKEKAREIKLTVQKRSGSIDEPSMEYILLPKRKDKIETTVAAINRLKQDLEPAVTDQLTPDQRAEQIAKHIHALLTEYKLCLKNPLKELQKIQELDGKIASLYQSAEREGIADPVSNILDRLIEPAQQRTV